MARLPHQPTDPAPAPPRSGSDAQREAEDLSLALTELSNKVGQRTKPVVLDPTPPDHRPDDQDRS